MWQQMFRGLKMMLVLTVLTGLAYPLVVTGLCQVFFHGQANGSLIPTRGGVGGSELIGQAFTRPEYFHPRPSAAGDKGYDGLSSGAANLGPTSQKLADRVAADVKTFRSENPDFTGPVPADLLTSSASGLDPDISPASAEAQVARVAAARGIPPAAVRQLVGAHMAGRQLGFLGEPRVNVLKLNLALDQSAPLRK